MEQYFRRLIFSVVPQDRHLFVFRAAATAKLFLEDLFMA
jgi:hypothetical protein